MGKSFDFWKLAPFICALLAVMNISIQYDDYHSKAEKALHNKVDWTAQRALVESQEALDAYRHILSAGKGAMQVNNRLSPEAWDVFSNSQELNTIVLGLQVYGYVEKVKIHDLYRYVSTIRRYEINDFRVYPRAKTKNKYIVKLSHEVESGIDIRSGFDMSSVPGLARTLKSAKSLGKFSISEPFFIDSSVELVAFILPSHVDYSTGEGEVRGWLFAIAEKEQLFSSLAAFDESGLNLQLQSKKPEEFLVFGSALNSDRLSAESSTSMEFSVGDAILQLSWQPTAEFVLNEQEKPPITGLVASAVIGGLLTVVAWLFSRIYGNTALQLANSQQRYALAVQAVQDGLIDWEDMREDKQFWSSVVWTFLGLSERESGGSYRVFHDAVHPEDRALFEREIATASSFDGSVIIPIRLKSQDEYRWYVLRARAIANGTRTRFIGRLTDDHERRNMEQLRETLVENLTKSNQELERFAYVASHDLQEPLRQVRSFSELALMELEDQPEQQRIVSFLKIVSDSSQHMQNLIVDLLDYAKPEDDNDLVCQVDLNDVLDKALGNLSEQISSSGAIIERGEMPTIQAHPLRLSRVLQNIIGNGLKYMEAGVTPRIFVSCKIVDAGCYLLIKDNGIGIEQKHLNSIFEPFKRLHNRSEYNGTGMGLSICQRIIRYYGGEIDVESQVGQGSTFTIFLPCCYGRETEKPERVDLTEQNKGTDDVKAA